jgi:hypothetical protein
MRTNRKGLFVSATFIAMAVAEVTGLLSSLRVPARNRRLHPQFHLPSRSQKSSLLWRNASELKSRIPIAT